MFTIVGESPLLPMSQTTQWQAGTGPGSNGESVTCSAPCCDPLVETGRSKLRSEPVAQIDNSWQELRDPFSNLACGYYTTQIRGENEKPSTIPPDERRRQMRTYVLMDRAESQPFVRPEFHLYCPSLKKLSGYMQKIDLPGFLPDHTRMELEARTHNLLDRMLSKDGPEDIDHLTERWLNEVIPNITLAWESEMEKGAKDTILVGIRSANGSEMSLIE